MLRWQKQVFAHTRLSRAYLALARLSCLIYVHEYVEAREASSCVGVGAANPWNGRGTMWNVLQWTAHVGRALTPK